MGELWREANHTSGKARACTVVVQSAYEDARQTCDFVPRKEREAQARRARIPRSPTEGGWG
jgi:hypothetical protein